MSERMPAIIDRGQQVGTKVWEVTSEIGPLVKDHPWGIVIVLGLGAAAVGISSSFRTQPNRVEGIRENIAGNRRESGVKKGG